MRRWRLFFFSGLIVILVIAALQRGSTGVDGTVVHRIATSEERGEPALVSPPDAQHRAIASRDSSTTVALSGPGPADPSPPSPPQSAVAIVEDRATGAPIEGATLARYPTNGRRLLGDHDWEVVDTSAADGRVDVDLQSPPADEDNRHANLFVFASPQHGLSVATLADHHVAPNAPRRIRLSRSAEVHGRVYGPGFDGVAGVSIELKARSGDLFQESETPDGSRDLIWRQELDGSGAFTIGKLPANIRYEVRLRAGELELWKSPDNLRLAPGEQREVDWFLGPGSTIRVSVTEQSGGPAENVELSLDALRQRGWHYGRGFTDAVRKLRTNASGIAVFTGVPTGNWTIVITSPPLPPGEDPGLEEALAKAPAPALYEVDVTRDEHEYLLDLTLYRGHYIEGRVLDWRGDPVRPSVSARSDENGVRSGKRLEDERFRIGPILPGEYEVKASSRFSASSIPGDPVLAKTGDRDVVLHLQRGATLSVTVVDRATGAPAVASIDYEPGSGGGGSTSHPSQPGATVMNGIRPGPFALVAETSDGRKALYRSEGIPPGERAEIRVEVGAQTWVDVHYAGEHSSVMVVLESIGTHLGQERVSAQSPALLPVPPGPITLEGFIRDANGKWKLVLQKKVTVIEGETLRVDLSEN